MTVPAKKPDSQRQRRLLELGEQIDYQFADPALLNLALSHSSLGNEGLPNYERLEFLGDAILGFLVADSLYLRRPEIVVGELTSRRSLLVSRSPLALVAADLRLGDYILVGRGLSEDALKSPRILADLVESVLGAIYVDGGIQPARRFVQRFILDRFKSAQTDLKPITDPKTRLNQWAQSHGYSTPNYRIIDSHGPDHDPTFKVAVTIGGIRCESAEVKSKQDGEQRAASTAYVRIIEQHRLCLAENGGEDQAEESGEETAEDEISVIWDE